MIPDSCLAWQKYVQSWSAMHMTNIFTCTHNSVYGRPIVVTITSFAKRVFLILLKLNGLCKSGYILWPAAEYFCCKWQSWNGSMRTTVKSKRKKKKEKSEKEKKQL